MKTIFLAILLIACSSDAAPKFLPHILPDAPSSAYRGKYILDTAATRKAGDSVQEAIKLGERNMAWLAHMNSFRPEGKEIQLTKPGDLKGIPIEEPKTYSPKTVTEDFKTTYAEMPADMAKILYSSVPFTDDTPIAEEEYITWAKKVDRNYQTAVRWILMEPYIPYLSLRRAEDLRGYYFLNKKTSNVESTLRSIDTLPADQKAQITEWLTQMCQNGEGLSSFCETRVEEAIERKTAFEFYLRYLGDGETIWNGYFSLENPRPEISWTASKPNVMTIPFMDPLNAKIMNFLKFNIEDEFKWDLWNLKLDFVAQTPIHVEFEPGVTPHVNAAGGDTITMDANAPLTEWDVQWTIRHEFGHV
ncbi:MAG: hypothetical protein ACXWC9_03310, partial [Pseudobdellovibrionaceae bacterium]